MNNKTIVLVAVVALFACVAAGYVVSEELDAAKTPVADPVPSTSTLSVVEKKAYVDSNGDASFTIGINGPVTDGDLKIGAYWFAATGTAITAPTDWVKLYADGDLGETTVRDIDVTVAKGTGYHEYNFSLKPAVGMTNLILCFAAQAYKGTDLTDGTALDASLTQYLYYNVLLIKSTTEALTHGSSAPTYVKDKSYSGDAQLTTYVTNSDKAEGKWYATGLPEGLTMDSTGKIYGTPTTVFNESTENVTVMISFEDKVIVGKINMKVTASEQPTVKLTAVTGAKALTNTTATTDAETWIAYTGEAVGFKLTATHVNPSYSYRVFAVSENGEEALVGSTDVITADGDKTFTFTPAGEGEFFFKVKLYNVDGTNQYASEVILKIKVIEKVKDVEAGIVFTPELTPEVNP